MNRRGFFAGLVGVSAVATDKPDPADGFDADLQRLRLDIERHRRELRFAQREAAEQVASAQAHLEKIKEEFCHSRQKLQEYSETLCDPS